MRIISTIKYRILGGFRCLHSASVPTRNLKNDTEMLAEDVLIQDVGDKCLITLNRPQSLNALNPSIYRKLCTKIRQLQSSKELVIRGSGGKAFCAGGDLKSLFTHMDKKDGYEEPKDFFRTAYTFFHMIASYKKPSVSLIDGITMGGGAGLSMHSKYRVATENTVFAMPENRIGLFPDAGATYFLPRLKGKLGLFMGLTGYRLTGIDVYLAGIATHYISSEGIQELTKRLLGNEDVEKILGDYKPEASNFRFSLEPHMERINRCFSASTVEEIIEKLEAENMEWTNSVIRDLEIMSPTSLKVAKKSLEMGARQNLSECLKMEFRLSCAAVEKKGDLYEGIRALLIAKDQKPVWDPKTLSEVSDDDVNQRFAPLINDLEL